MKEERPADVKERQQKLKKRDRQILKRETTDIKDLCDEPHLAG